MVCICFSFFSDYGCFCFCVDSGQCACFADIEKLLVRVDAVKDTDQRLGSTGEDDEDGNSSRIKTGNGIKAKVEDDEDDWD